MAKKKKSFNPFRMFGSYLGAFLALVYLAIATKFFLFDTRDLLLLAGFTLSAQTGGLISASLLAAAIGFLVGWGIHSLSRGLSK